VLFFLLANVSFAIAQSRIKSTVTGGSWSTTFTWIGGVIPSSLDTVEAVPGSNVTLNILSTIVDKADIKGTLDFASTGATFMVNGNTTVFTGGKLNAFNVSTGKSVVVNGNFINNGIIEFSRAGCNLTFLPRRVSSFKDSAVDKYFLYCIVLK
jgi:hypothetical protein